MKSDERGTFVTWESRGTIQTETTLTKLQWQRKHL